MGHATRRLRAYPCLREDLGALVEDGGAHHRSSADAAVLHHHAVVDRRALLHHDAGTQHAAHDEAGDVGPVTAGSRGSPPSADASGGTIGPVRDDRPVRVVEDVDPSGEQVAVGLEVEARLADVTPVAGQRDRGDLAGLHQARQEVLPEVADARCRRRRPPPPARRGARAASPAKSLRCRRRRSRSPPSARGARDGFLDAGDVAVAAEHHDVVGGLPLGHLAGQHGGRPTPRRRAPR